MNLQVNYVKKYNFYTKDEIIKKIVLNNYWIEDIQNKIGVKNGSKKN